MRKSDVFEQNPDCRNGGDGSNEKSIFNGSKFICAIFYWLISQVVSFNSKAFWSRFFPVYGMLRSALDNGEIGQPKFVRATFTYDMTGYIDFYLVVNLKNGIFR